MNTTDSNSMETVANSRRVTWERVVRVWFAMFAASLVTGVFLAQVMAGIGGLLVLVAVFRGKVSAPGKHPALYALAAAAVIQLLSASLAAGPLHSIASVFRYYTFPLIGLFAVVWLGRDERVLRLGFITLLIAGAVTGLYGIFQHLTGLDPLYGQFIKQAYPGYAFMPAYYPKGLLGMTLTFAGVQMLLILLGLPSALRLQGREALLVRAALVLMTLSLYVTYKRSALIGLVAGAGVLFLARGRKMALAFLVSCVVLFGVLMGTSEVFRVRVQNTIGMKTESEQERLFFWKAAWEMGLDHPVLGVGPGNWSRYRDEYLPERENWTTRAHAHSDPLQLWATTGILGFFTASVVFVLLLVRGSRDLKRVNSPPLAHDLLQASLIALVGFAFASLFQCNLLDAETLFMLCFILGMGIAAGDLAPETISY